MSILGISAMARLPVAHLQPRQTSWTAVRAALTLGAAAIHLAVMPQHFQEYALYGVFFLLPALAKAGLAAALLVSPERLVATVGMAGNLAIVALWVVSRTGGLPIGYVRPDPPQPPLRHRRRAR